MCRSTFWVQANIKPKSMQMLLMQIATPRMLRSRGEQWMRRRISKPSWRLAEVTPCGLFLCPSSLWRATSTPFDYGDCDLCRNLDYVHPLPMAALTRTGLLAQGTPSPTTSLPKPDQSGIDHIVVVTMENRSFDHILGWLPGANGMQAGLSYTDRAGNTVPIHDLLGMLSRVLPAPGCVAEAKRPVC